MKNTVDKNKQEPVEPTPKVGGVNWTLWLLIIVALVPSIVTFVINEK